MTDEPINLVLEHLRAIRADLGLVRDVQREHGERLNHIEIGISRIGGDYAHDAEMVAHMGARIDRLRDDVERIKTRLDLRES